MSYWIVEGNIQVVYNLKQMCSRFASFLCIYIACFCSVMYSYHTSSYTEYEIYTMGIISNEFQTLTHLNDNSSLFFIFIIIIRRIRFDYYNLRIRKGRIV